nr:MAG TPA: hypothetical protein [Caudoviricetes sp.]
MVFGGIEPLTVTILTQTPNLNHFGRLLHPPDYY